MCPSRNRWFGVIVAVAVCPGALLAARPAWAHGGSYSPPVSGPMPPPSKGPSAPPPASSGPIAPPTTITPGETWQTWWDLNRLAYLPGRDETLRRRVVTPDAEGGDDGATIPGLVDEVWARRRVEAAQSSLVPFLLRLLDPRRRSPDEVVAAALIALAKIGQAGVHIPVLLGTLRDEKAPPLVRESAAIAVGLLRRSRPELQLEGCQLDRLREQLLDVFDEKDAPDQVRAFAALSLGLLADQPYGNPETSHGRAVVAALWSRLLASYARQDLPVALISALSLQPPEGAGRDVREGLHALASGRTVRGRRLDAQEQAHAVAAAVRLRGSEVHEWLLRLIWAETTGDEVRRAAAIAIGRRAEALTARERSEGLWILLVSLKEREDALTSGLTLLALGRLLGVELVASPTPVRHATTAMRVLLEDALGASNRERGFAVVGLSLAARTVRATDPARPFVADARRLLFEGLRRARGDDAQVAAYPVGMGLLGMEEALDRLRELAADRGNAPVLRGHSAAALGQIGRSTAPVRACLLGMLAEEKGGELRMKAAVALGLLGGSLLRTRLVEELRDADSEVHLTHVLIALGYLGDLAAVPDLLGFAADEKRSDLTRALAVAALGMLTDPEPRPSILRLTEDANYPAATGSLYAAFALF